MLTAMRYAIYALGSVCLGLIAFMAALRACPAIVVYFHPVKISTPYCSRWKTVLDSFKERFDLEDGIHQSTRLLESDGRLRRFSTNRGEWWVPEGSPRVLPILLSQQETDLYGEIRPGDVVVDCGAHVGVFTRHALVRGASKVIAVEPAPDPLECLRRNLAREIADGRVVIISKGIWDSQGELSFALNGNADAAGSFVHKGSSAPQIVVPVTTIDALVAEYGPVTLIKADIKGAAPNMLRGARETLLRYRPRLVIATEERSEDPGELVNLARSIQPKYRESCGRCYLADGAIQLEVLFLQ
jgi:FkbM family methyltransferase